MSPNPDRDVLNLENKEKVEGSINPVFEETLTDERGGAYADYIPEVKLFVVEDVVKDPDDNTEEAEEDKDDPWALTELKYPGTPWSELDGCGKVKRVLWDYLGKFVILMCLLYMFICSLDFLSTAFKLLGGKAAGQVFSESELLKNPVTGLMIGVLATVLLQSSSTTTSIVVTMVSASILSVEIAIPIVMGANIGTSVTNTIVAVGQMADRNEFRKAFAAATVHDMFNLLCVLIFLPLEVGTREYMFMHVAESWGDTVIGALLLVMALGILCVCLVLIVKLLHSLLKGRIASVLKKVVNANFPAITPLVGAGVLHIKRMYPLTLGANIGTTCTSILAALASDGDTLGYALQISFCHLFFNVFGIVVWYPIPFMRKIPIRMAKVLGNTTAQYRWFAIFYIILMFFLLPAFVFALSVAGFYVLAGVGIPIFVIFLVIIIINVIQRKRPGCLPTKLHNWDFLPLWMYSLDPVDRLISKVLCCKRCKSDDGKDVDEMEKDGVYDNTTGL